MKEAKLTFTREDWKLISEAIRGYIQYWSGTIPQDEEDRLHQIWDAIEDELGNVGG